MQFDWQYSWKYDEGLNDHVDLIHRSTSRPIAPIVEHDG